MTRKWLRKLVRWWRRARLVLLAGGTIFLSACRTERELPIVVTQVVMVGGEEIVVTRLLRQTVQVPVTVAPGEVTRPPVQISLAFLGQPATFDPQQATAANELDVVESLFVGLTNHNHRTNTIEPELARSWEVSDDRLVWTFHLRDDIFWLRAGSTAFSQGMADARAVRPVVAGDVVYAIQRACHPERSAPDTFILFIIEGCERLHRLADPQAADLEAIGATAPNDLTLEVRLTRPAAYFLTITSLWPMRPVPPEVVTAAGDTWLRRETLLTSGPFFRNPRSLDDNRLVLQRSPFWPLPFSGNVDLVNVFYLDDEMDALVLWQERTLELSPVPLAEQANLLNANPHKVDLVPRQEVFYVAFNFNSPAFRVPQVRQAFAAAIDRQRLVREVYGGRGLPARHFAPLGVLLAPPFDQVGLTYSPDLARQRIATSGFNDCRLMPPVRFLVSSADTGLHQAELLVTMWREELGCAESQFEVEQVQFGTLLASTRRDAGAARPDIWELGWASYYPDPQDWLGDVLHCETSENRQDRPCSEVDDLIAQAALLLDSEQRAALYRQVETLFFGEEGIFPLVPLYIRGDYVLRQSWLTYTPAPFGGEQFDTYEVDVVLKELELRR